MGVTANLALLQCSDYVGLHDTTYKTSMTVIECTVS